MIDILMAVYNGGDFLAEQIESILGQSVGGWHLYICDDGSKDKSFRIASEYAEKYPDLITVSRNEVPTGSACGNFMGMLRKSSAEYVMFSDQDDFWLPDKIKLTLKKMRELEVMYPASPILVHTELEIVDRELNVTALAFTKFQGLDPRKKSLNRLLCQNNITGCTVMMNRALADIIKDTPAEKMLMHDWWAGLAAAAFGQIGFVDTPTVKYRQHGGNQVGAVRNNNASGIVHIIKKKEQTKKRLEATYIQAEKFFECYSSRLDIRGRNVLEKYRNIPVCSKPMRVAELIRYDFLKQSVMAAAGQLIFC